MMMPRLFRGLFGTQRPHEVMPGRRDFFDPKRPESLNDEAAIQRRSVFDAARAMPDDTLCDDNLLAAIDGEALARRLAAGTAAGPGIPRCSDLRIRHSGLPSWWTEGGNLLLAAPGSGPKEFSLTFMPGSPRNVVAVFGTGTEFSNASFFGDNSFMFLGDDVKLVASNIVIGPASTVMFGERSTATFMCNIDVRNGGLLAVGADAMFAAGIRVLSDDLHAIRDVVTNRRLNRYGGRILIDRHVWIGEQSQLMGDCSIGPDAIIGAGSFVKNAVLPGQAVSVGRPARPVRTGVTWNRIDAP